MNGLFPVEKFPDDYFDRSFRIFRNTELYFGLLQTRHVSLDRRAFLLNIPMMIYIGKLML